MLRLMAKTVYRLWDTKPKQTYAIHLWHIDLGYGGIKQELTTRIKQDMFAPALAADIASEPGSNPSLAEDLDKSQYPGQSPYASAVARTIFMHSLAYNDLLKGLGPQELRYSILSPAMDISFIDDARLKFVQESSYLEDRTDSKLRFLTEANLLHLIRQEMKRVDPNDIRNRLNAEIKEVFQGKSFELIVFPAFSTEIPDGEEEKPFLCILGYDAVDVAKDELNIPELMKRLWLYKGTDGSFRGNRNDVVFVVTDKYKIESMKESVRRHLALSQMLRNDTLKILAKHQQSKLREEHTKSKAAMSIAIQQAYSHCFYPSKIGNVVEGLFLSQATIDLPNASANPGEGQNSIIRILSGLNKIKKENAHPDAPAYIKARTPLGKGGIISTKELRQEYRSNVDLPMLIGNNTLKAGIAQGVELGEFVYQDGDLVWKKGDPKVEFIKLDANVFVMTEQYAREQGLFKEPDPEPDPNLKHGDKKDEDTKTIKKTTKTTGDDETTGDEETEEAQKNEFSESGTLKESFTKIFENIRYSKIKLILSIDIGVVESQDMFMIASIADRIKFQKEIHLSGSYSSANGTTFEFKCDGNLADSANLRNFLKDQFRSPIKDKEMNTNIIFTFENGLDVNSNEIQDFVSRFDVAGASDVFVKVKVKV